MPLIDAMMRRRGWVELALECGGLPPLLHPAGVLKWEPAPALQNFKGALIIRQQFESPPGFAAYFL